MSEPEPTPHAERIAETIAVQAMHHEVTVAAAESLTSGQICAALGAASDASEWFRGGVVAYSRFVKYDVLDVPTGPVVTPECAQTMAGSVRRLTGASIAVAVTGAGGPDPQDGADPGTVHIGISTPQQTYSHRHRFAGEPADVVEQTVIAALENVRDVLDRWPA